MKTIYERLDEILPILTDSRFRENKGLGNEIGYYIFDYDAKDETIVREHINFLKQKINNEGIDVSIREFDLYEIMIDILEGKGYLQKVFDMEREKGTDAVFRAIKNTLRLTQKNDLIVNHIRKRVEKNDIVFLTGVGKIWPIIRSHTVLNVLHSVIDHVPLIMFYPGTYSGQNLHLFDEISDRNYYRAFKLVER
ncbi:MAG: DUF1788 domain-containing protein [Tissierellaceae bacterium]|nr:DUF1788 domain-containing protein [Tissierellaceae bacterium]